MMSTSPRRTGLRLATSSAIALSAALALSPAGPARAQSLPVVSDPGGATISTAGNTLTVNINDANRIIQWTTFDVDPGRVVNFNTADGATPFSVLNRVVTNAQSDINGTINSQNNIAVWLVNQTGILFGPSGSFSGGRLVLSTLDLDASFTDANFLAGTGMTRFSGASTNAITLQGGGGGIAANGSFIAIGQDITVAKTVTATGGDVALIAARDVSFPVGLGSPLSITINQGTTLATARVDSSGAITGENVRLVGASQAGAIANLLNVSGGSLTATAVDGAVVLATGTVAARNVTVTTPGGDGIAIAGPLNPGANRDLTLNANGGLTIGGALAGRDVSVTGASGVPVTNVAAARDLSLTQTTGALTFNPNALGAATWGRNISLTAAGNVDISSATPFNSPGAISITSTGGDIVSNNPLFAILNAGTGPTFDDITLTAAGSINIAAGTALLTGLNGRDISLTAGGTIIPANVNARRDLSITDTTGAFTFDPSSVTWGRDITLTASTGDLLVTGNLSSPGAARLTSGTADVRADSVATTNGLIAVTAAAGAVRGNGAATMTVNAQGANGDVAIIANGAIDLANVTAANSMGIRSANGAISGATFDAGEDIAIDGGGTVNLAALTADDDIGVQAAGLVTLGTVTTDGSGPDTRTVNVTGTPIAFTASAADNANISLRSTGGNLVLSGSAATSGAAGGDITLGAAGTVDAKNLSSARNVAVTAPGGVVTTGDVTYTAGGTVTLPNLTASGSIAIRSAGNLSGAVFDAGEDVALGVTGPAGTVNVTTINADDDIDVTAGGAITIGTALSRGTGPDTRRVNLSTPAITFDAPEPADHIGSSVRLTSSGGAVNVTTNATTQGADGRDILLSGTTVNAGSLTAARDIGITGPVATVGAVNYAATAGSIKANSITTTTGSITLTAGTEVTGNSAARMALTAGGAASNANVTATTGRALLGAVTAGNSVTVNAGSAADISSATATAGNIGVTAGTSATFGSLTANSAAAGDVAVVTGTTAALGNVTAGRSLGVRAGGNISGSTISAGEDIAVQGAGVGSTVDLTSLTAGDDIDVNASGTVALGSASTTGNGGNARSVNVGAAPITFAAAVQAGSNIRIGSTGAGVALTSGATGSGRAGDISLQGNTTVQAGTLASALGAVSLASTTGNTTVANSVTAQNAVTINSGNDVLIADYVASGPESGFIRSTGGTVGITAARTVGRLSGPTAMTSVTGIDALAAGGAINITGGDVRLDSITAAGDVTVNITGSLTGTAAALGERGANLSGGGVFSAGATTIDAGNGAADLVRLNRIEAGGAVTVDATNIAIGTLRTPGAVTLTNPGGAFYIGLRSSPGDLTQAFAATVANANPASLTTTDDIEAGFGKVAITSTGGSITAIAGAIDNAELGAVSAANNIAITAQGLTATGAIQAGGSLALTATQGTLQIAGATAGTTAQVTKQGGPTDLGGNELRIFGEVTANGNANISSFTNARIGSVTSTAGNVGVIADFGEVSGVALAVAATDGRLLPMFDRANLSAKASGRLVSAYANSNAQLGTVSAGDGNGTAGVNQASITARVVDILSANATNGSLRVVASAGEVRLGVGAAGVDALVTGSTNARIGSLAARTGSIVATASNGQLTGLALATPATDGRAVAGFGRTDLTANGLNQTIRAEALGGAAQLGTLSAGTGATSAALAQITANGGAGLDLLSANAANGALTLLTGGNAIVGSGSGRSGASISSGGNVRLGSLSSQASASVVAAGEITGLAIAPGTPPPTSSLTTPLNPGFGHADISAGVAGDIFVSSSGIGQFGTLSAGTGIEVTARAMSVQTAATIAGALRLSVTEGALVLGTGSSGGLSFLSKSGFTGEIDIATLTTGTLDGSTGSAFLNSVTDVRVDSVTARGGDITILASNGQVTGRGGGRSTLTAALARDAGGTSIVGSDRSVAVTSGTLSRLGAVTAGGSVTVTAGANTLATRDGELDAITVTAARGDVQLRVFNDNPAIASGLTVGPVSAGNSALLTTTGSNGGAISVVGDLSARRDITVTSTGGGATLAGNVSAGSVGITGTLTINSSGALTLGAADSRTIRATGAVSLTAAGNISQGAGALTIQSNSDQVGAEALTVSATPSGSIALGNTAFVGGSTAGRESIVDLRAAGTVNVGAVNAAGLIIRASGAVTAGAIIAGNAARPVDPVGGFNTIDILSTAGGINLSTATATDAGHDIVLTAHSFGTGFIRANALLGARNISVSGWGLIDVTNATAASGFLSIASSMGLDAVRLGTGVAGTNAQIAGFSASAANLTAGGTLLVEALSGGVANLGTGTAGGMGTVRSIAGAANVTSLIAGGPAIVAAKNAAVVGTIQSTSADVMVSGGTVNVGLAQAGTALSATASNGNLTIDRGFAGTTGLLRTTGGNGDVSVITSLETGGGATVETVRNAFLNQVRAATGNVTVTAPNGVLTGPDGGATQLSANLTATAGAVNVATGSFSRLGTVAGGNGVVVASSSIEANSVNAGAGALSLIGTNGAVGLTTGTAGTSALVQAVGAASVQTLTAGTNATIQGASVNAASATATTGALLINATAGNAALGIGTAGGAGTVQASGAASVTTLTTGGLATLTAGTSASAGTIRSTGAGVVVTGGTVNLTTAQAATSLTAIASSGNLTIDRGIAGTTGLLRTTGGNGDVIVTTSLETGGAATVTSVSDARLALVRAASGDIAVTATGGEVTGVDPATSANFTATAGAVGVTNGLLSRLGTVAGNGVTVNSGSVVANTVNAGTGALSLTATNGPLSLATGNAGASALVQASGAVIVGSLTAGNDATVRGASANVTAATASAGNLLIEATAGNAALGAGSAGGSGTVQATGNAALSSLTVTGPATLTAGAAATAGSIRSTGANVSVSGGAVTVGTAQAAAALDVVATSGSLTLDRGTAGATGLLRTTGGNGDVVVGTALETGGGATVETVRDARLTLVRAATGNVTVTAPNGEVTGLGTAAANLAATAGAVNVTNGLLARLDTVGGNGVTVSSGSIVANDVNAGTGVLSLSASNGATSLTTGRAGTTALVGSTGATTVGTLTAGTDATIRGASVGATVAAATAGALLVEANAGSAALSTGSAGTSGTVRGTTAASVSNLTTGGALLVETTAGNATLGTGSAGGAGTVRASGAANLTSLTAAGTATLSAGTAGTAGTIRSTGANVLATGASLDIGAAQAATTLTATASGGNLALGTGTAGTTGALSTTGGAGDVSVATSLTTGGGATIGSVRHARLAAITATTGNVAVTAAGEVTGIGAGSANLVASAGAVNVQGGTLARLGTVGSAGATGVTVTADTIAAADVNAGTGALSLVADTGGVTLGLGRSGGAAVIDAKQTVTISSGLTTGASALIRAADAQIGGPVAAATRIDVVNTGTNNTLVLGGATGTGFVLDQTEINRLNAPEVTLDARSNNVAVGALAFDGDTGGSRVDVLGLGRVDVTGAVSAPGGSANRTVRFGGSATASDKASVIRVAATANGGGGRLLMPNAALELRGVKIGVGQDGRFLESLGLTPGGTPLSVAQAGTDFISNPQSTLYYAGNFGGAPYNPIGQTLVEASSLTVRTSDYALFQNTGTVGQSLGVALDARATNPRVPALTVSGPNPPDAGGFAIFGTINGIEASAAALLGATDISIVAVDGANTRINGCIVGSGGGGCLSNSIVQPVVNVFDSSRSDVLKTSSDFEAPFDPVVGTNNESLFGDVGTFGLEEIPLTPDTDPAVEECGGPDQAPCAASEGETK